MFVCILQYKIHEMLAYMLKKAITHVYSNPSCDLLNILSFKKLLK